jgi:monoamine oxidase
MLDHIEGDAAICTIPYTVLRRVPVTPEWSPEKRRVIDNIYYGPCVRTTYQVSRRYWEDEELNGSGTSDKNFEVWHPTYGKPGKRGLLQAYNYENYAHELDQLSEADWLEQTIRDMDEVFPGLRPSLETVVVKSWANDPWQCGGVRALSHRPDENQFRDLQAGGQSMVCRGARVAMEWLDAGSNHIRH